MKLPEEQLWTFVNGFLISTANMFNQGFETLVFPAGENAGVRVGSLHKYVVEVDFGKPIVEYARNYKKIDDAERGHKETVEAVKNNKCDRCINSRSAVSKYGVHWVCTLSLKKAKDCHFGKEDWFISKDALIQDALKAVKRMENDENA